eukprot:153778-Rhodomonas_salina.1
MTPFDFCSLVCAGCSILPQLASTAAADCRGTIHNTTQWSGQVDFLNPPPAATLVTLGGEVLVDAFLPVFVTLDDVHAAHHDKRTEARLLLWPLAGRAVTAATLRARCAPSRRRERFYSLSTTQSQHNAKSAQRNINVECKQWSQAFQNSHHQHNAKIRCKQHPPFQHRLYQEYGFVRLSTALPSPALVPTPYASRYPMRLIPMAASAPSWSSSTAVLAAI